MAQKSGTITQVTATLSSPAVNYKLEYTATRSAENDKTVSFSFPLSAWLNSSLSSLKRGIKLTLFLRVGGGAWNQATIKNANDVWSGTDTHSAQVTSALSLPYPTAKVEFYISRMGSTYGGTAGVVGSEKKPLVYTVEIPPYQATPTPPDPPTPPEPETQSVFVAQSGTLKPCFVVANGKTGDIYVVTNGQLKRV